MAPQRKLTESERQAALRAAAGESEYQAVLTAADEVAKAMLLRAPFRDRGFSDRTIDALIAHGIDAPERLLFASETALKRIRSIGKASFEEIVRYRTRFIRKW
jgi:DNA-directed RNA polymerase alpha subunit